MTCHLPRRLTRVNFLDTYISFVESFLLKRGWCQSYVAPRKVREAFDGLAALIHAEATAVELPTVPVVICPDCGKYLAFRGGCPKCGSRSLEPAGAQGGIEARRRLATHVSSRPAPFGRMP